MGRARIVVRTNSGSGRSAAGGGVGRRQAEVGSESTHPAPLRAADLPGSVLAVLPRSASASETSDPFTLKAPAFTAPGNLGSHTPGYTTSTSLVTTDVKPS